MINREQEHEMRRVIARERGSVLWHAMHDLAQADFEKTKEQMVSADAEQLMALQGRAQALRGVLKWLTSTPDPV